MTEDLPLTDSISARSEQRTVASASGTRLSRASTSPRVGTGGRGAAPKRSYFAVFLVIVLTVGLATLWSLIAHRELKASILSAQAERLDKVPVAFSAARKRTQATLQAHSRILVEDPRLKSTLATENMDAATVDDILADLGKLRGAGFFMVLSPEGRVFAEAGAKELRGLDLSESSIVKRAQTEPTGAVGSWVLGARVMDLSIMAIRYGDALIAYLVVGQAIDEQELRSLSDQCGCEVATALGSTVSVAASPDDSVKQLFATMAGESEPSRGRVREAGGTSYATTVVELGDVTQSHRLLLASSVGAATASSWRLWWLLWLPPMLVLIAVVFALSTIRSSRRLS